MDRYSIVKEIVSSFKHYTGEKPGSKIRQSPIRQLEYIRSLVDTLIGIEKEALKELYGTNVQD